MKAKNSIQDEQIKTIQKNIQELNNSYKVLNDHSHTMSSDIQQIKTDIDWLKWAVRIVLFGIVVSIAITIFIPGIK